MAYSADSFVADEVPTTAKWNKLWTNDASFNDGTGIDDDTILERHIADNVVSSEKLDATIAFKAYRNAAHNVTTSPAKVPLDAESYDLGDDYNTSTTRFVAPVTGYYSVFAQLYFMDPGDQNRLLIFIYKNGSEVVQLQGSSSGAATDPGVSVYDVIPMTASDYLEVYGQVTSGTVALTTGANRCYMVGHYIGA